MSTLTRKKEDNAYGQVLTFFSTASATGKTTLAINFVADLAERGFRACLLDADLQFGDVANCLKLDSSNNIFHMYEDEEANAADIVVGTDWKFDVLPSPLELDEGFLINADIVVRAINHLKANYDYVVIDTTTGFSDINMSILEKTDTLFMPCVVDFIPSIKNLKLGLETLARIQFDSDSIRLILNRNKAETQISTKDVEALLGREFQYFVGNDYNGMMRAVKAAEPIVLSKESNDVADDISAIIAKELGEEVGTNKTSGIFSWLWN